MPTRGRQQAPMLAQVHKEEEKKGRRNWVYSTFQILALHMFYLGVL